MFGETGRRAPPSEGYRRCGSPILDNLRASVVPSRSGKPNLACSSGEKNKEEETMYGHLTTTPANVTLPFEGVPDTPIFIYLKDDHRHVNDEHQYIYIKDDHTSVTRPYIYEG